MFKINYKNQTHLDAIYNGFSFNLPMKKAKNRGVGFYKYNKYNLKNNG
jgi:hypothetical protein